MLSQKPARDEADFERDGKMKNNLILAISAASGYNIDINQ